MPYPGSQALNIFTMRLLSSLSRAKGYPPMHYLYTLGIVFFEILTGKNLFNTNRHSNRNSLLDRKIRHLHPYVSDVCPEFELPISKFTNFCNLYRVDRHLDIVALQEILDKLQVCAQASD